MRITLAWQGPIGAGLFPADPARLEPYRGSGVYLRLKRYAGGRSVSYVGQSRDVLTRIDQHLTAMLALQTPLRDHRGRPAFAGDSGARLAAYGELEAIAALAAQEVMRTRFVVAPCGEDFADDRLDLVEGALKARLELRIAAGAGLAACENIQGIAIDPFADVLAIDQDRDALDAEYADLVARALGGDPIALDGASIGAVHAE